MINQLMSTLHQAAPWDWTLSGREVQTLAAAPSQRWLRVEEGCLWLTRRDSHGQREDDVWLVAGESLALPAASEWVLEAWPLARVSLLQQAAVRRDAGSAWRPRATHLPWLRFSVLHA